MQRKNNAELSNKVYVDAVISEIKNLRKYATKEEKERLNFRFFNPFSAINCIYGQMTRGCCSPRAQELAIKCSEIFNKVTFESVEDDYFLSSKEEIAQLDLVKICFTPLEHFICSYIRDNKHILAYIKGEVNRLKLTQVTNQK